MTTILIYKFGEFWDVQAVKNDHLGRKSGDSKNNGMENKYGK